MNRTDFNNEGLSDGLSLPSGDIAIIGMACKFPGATNYLEFWENLQKKVNSVSEIPSQRWNWRDYDGDPLKEENKSTSKWGGFISDVDKFDAAFFNISPGEADFMDPQQRIMLELCWSCIENAGYIPSQLGSEVGVYVGICNYDYKSIYETNFSAMSAYYPTGLALGTMVPNRISYYFNFQGPSVTIDTACSSSLVALHNAANSIRTGECNYALVGGVNIILNPEKYNALSKLGMLSSKGSCKTFDESADGYIRSEGAGVVLLKSLDKAIKDNDNIYGVLKGVAVNHGGKARTLTSPNSFAISKVIQKALKNAGISPETITYVETHGTGTPVGDPLEIVGLKRAFGNPQANGNPKSCGIGSVKTNIGHLEAAAGMAGLIKMLMCLRDKKLVPLQNFEKLNPKINIDDSIFYTVNDTIDWKSLKVGDIEIPRRAGISSFGVGGTNAHAIIEEYILRDELEIASPDTDYLILLSAKNKERLREQVEQLIISVNEKRINDTCLANVAYTLQVGREAMDTRLAIIVNSVGALKDKLIQFLKGDKDIPNLFDSPYDNFTSANPDSIDYLVHKLMEDKNYPVLTKLWINKISIDWSKLYAETKPRKISLPTYPFEKKRHWFAFDIKTRASDTTSAVNAKDVVKIRTKTSITIEDVKYIISSLTQLDLKDVSPEISLFNIGVDSIMFFPLLQRLSQEFPGLDLKKSGDELLSAASLRELTAKLNELTNKEISNADQEQYEIETLFLPLKSDVNNVVCESIKLVRQHPIEVEGSMIINESHPFFFDHALDHVSGIHLVAALNDISSASICHKWRLINTAHLFVKELFISFQNFCLKDKKIALHTYEVEPDKNLNEAHLKVKVTQEGKQSASGRFIFSKIEDAPKKLNEVRIKSLTHCHQDIVNKRNTQNVFISEVMNDKERDKAFCWLRTLSDGTFFADYQGDYVDSVALLEAARQSFRAFNYYHDDGPRGTGNMQENEMLVSVKSMKLTLKRPVLREEAIQLIEDLTEKTEIGNNYLMTLKGSFISGTDIIGSFEIVAMCLDLKVYEKWRNDEVKSPLYLPNV